MQASRPCSFLPPLQVELSVTLEHRYGHHTLLDMINKLICFSSYSEALKYRMNAATTQGVDVVDELGDTFVQYQDDNIDHASRTQDGHGSIHVMGQMATFKPAISTAQKFQD